jgi:hypothetical protein
MEVDSGFAVYERRKHLLSWQASSPVPPTCGKNLIWMRWTPPGSTVPLGGSTLNSFRAAAAAWPAAASAPWLAPPPLPAVIPLVFAAACGAAAAAVGSSPDSRQAKSRGMALVLVSSSSLIHLHAQWEGSFHRLAFTATPLKSG